jgi:hypothetical protein
MNLSEAHRISNAATVAIDTALAAAQLLLSRKKQERAKRAEGFKSIIMLMEAELEMGDAEIADLEKMIFGEPAATAGLDTDDHSTPNLAEADEEARQAFRQAKYPEAAE